jgi:hypothetical protein
MLASYARFIRRPDDVYTLADLLIFNGPMELV